MGSYQREQFFVLWILPVFTLTYHTGKVLTLSLKFLETRKNKQISSDTLPELAEIVLKNNIFEFDEKAFKQKCGTVIGTNFLPPNAILFMTDLEEKILEIFEKKTQ